MAITGDSNPCSQRIIISELLASTIHASMTGRTADDMVPVFTKFYNQEEIEKARDNLISLGCKIGKKSARKDSNSKLREITEIVKFLTDLDWQGKIGKEVVFAAVNFTRICYVPINLSDDVQLRTEVTSLHKRFNDLESVCKDLIAHVEAVTTKVTESTNKMKQSATSVMSKLNISSTPDISDKQPPPPPPISSARPSSLNIMTTPLYSQIAALQTLNSDHNTNDEPKQWSVVARKKKSKPKPLVLGQGNSMKIKTIPAIKVASVFLSRCDPSTTEDNINDYIAEEKSWNVTHVAKLNTKFNNYASFRIDIIRKYHDDGTLTSESEYMKPEHWPKNSIVKRFNRNRFNGQSPFSKQINYD